MNNLKTNLDSIILLLCQASSDHDAQMAEKDQEIEQLKSKLQEANLEKTKYQMSLGITEEQLRNLVHLAQQDARGWIQIERALRVEATERIRELSEQLLESEIISEKRKEDILRYADSLGKSRKENREAYEQCEQLREENKELMEAYDNLYARYRQDQDNLERRGLH